MVEVTLSLTEEQAEELNRYAARMGQPMEAILQRSVEDMLAGQRSREERVVRFMSLAGRFHSGPADVAENHDDYLSDDEPA